MDYFSPVKPAQIRVLVLPVGQFESTRFASFVRHLHNEASIVTLRELIPHTNKDGLLLAPTSFPNGKLLYDYNTSIPNEQHRQLSPFELFREPLLVLGVIDCAGTEVGASEQELASATEFLRERHPRVVHRQLMVLDQRPRTEEEKQDGVVYVAEADQKDHSSLKSAICTLSVRFLEELSTYTAAIQALPNIQTPVQSKSRSQRASSLRDGEKRPASSTGAPMSAASAAVPITPTNESAPTLAHSDTASPPPALSEQYFGFNSSIAPLSRSDSQSSNQSKGARASDQDRISVQGFGSGTSHEKLRNKGKSRVGIVIGALYMTAGQWGEALRILVEHTTKARTLSDNIWYGKGLDNIVSCLLLHILAGLEVQIPLLCSQTADKSSASHQRFSVNLPTDFRAADPTSQSAGSRLASHLPDLLRHVLSLYRSNEGSFELSTLITLEASVRFSKLLGMINASNGEIDSMLLKSLISPPKMAAAGPRLVMKIGPKSLPRSVITQMLPQGHLTSTKEVSIGDVLGILAGSATVYGILGMNRKRAMVLRELVIRLTEVLTQAQKRGAADMGIHPTANLDNHSTIGKLLDNAFDSGISLMVSEVAISYGICLQDLSASGLDHKIGLHGVNNAKVTVAKELIAFCQASLQPHSAVHVAASMLSNSAIHGAVDSYCEGSNVDISPEEESGLFASMVQATERSNKLGLSPFLATFWDPYLVRGIEFPNRGSDTAVIDISKVGLEARSKSPIDPDNPLLYDRNSSRPGTAVETPVAILVLEEVAECTLTLQNSRYIPIEIEQISLVTDGVDLITNHRAVTLGPRRVQQVVLSVATSAIGEGRIIGCRIQVAGCAEHIFPIVKMPWVSTMLPLLKATKQSEWIILEDPRTEIKPSVAQEEVLRVTVIPAQPTLEVFDLSAKELNVMLLEGERRQLTAKLRNSSTAAAAVLWIASVNDAIAIFQDQSDSYLFKPEGSRPQIIEAQTSSSFEFILNGKPGISRAQVMFYYSTTLSATKYARVTTFAIDLTVNAALRLQHLDVLSLDQDDPATVGKYLLLSMAIENARLSLISYKCSLKSINGDESPPAVDEGVIAPGEVKRISLRFLRSALGIKYTDDTASIRDALANCLSVSWSTEGRSGIVDFEQFNLSADALQLLRGSPVQVAVKLLTEQEPTVNIGSFNTVRICIDFEKEGPALGPLLVQLYPRATHLPELAYDERHIGIAGSLQRLLMPESTGKQEVVDFVVCPMLTGSMELLVAVRPAHMSAAGVASSWHASGVLRLEVV